mgnify:CR=1 FL=1
MDTDKLFEQVKLGNADIDSLVHELVTSHPLEEMQDGHNHISWIKRECMKLLRSHMELADKEAKLVRREAVVTRREKAISRNQ